MTKGQTALFVHSSDPHRVLFFAVPATPQETLATLASLGIFHLVHVYASTLDAAGSAAPAHQLEQFDRRRFVGAG